MGCKPTSLWSERVLAMVYLWRSISVHSLVICGTFCEPIYTLIAAINFLWYISRRSRKISGICLIFQLIIPTWTAYGPSNLYPSKVWHSINQGTFFWWQTMFKKLGHIIYIYIFSPVCNYINTRRISTRFPPTMYIYGMCFKMNINTD